jgi:nitrate/nitrite-specific signal transduction histidine kinase
VASVKKDFQQILNYKSDLEALVEDQTQHLEQKNRKLFAVEQEQRQLQAQIDQTEQALKR